VTRPLLLAVDAGNSKVDAALVGADGAVLGLGRVINPPHAGSGTRSHLQQVAAVVAATCSGLEPATRAVAELGVYCLAGADFPADDRRIARWIRRQGWTVADLVRNDTFAVLRAGTERTWGVAVVCGHGTNCAGLAPDGRTYRIPAVGTISGDWGGGLAIGEAALWYAVRAEDGRGAPTQLASIVPAHLGMKRPGEVTEALHFGRMESHRLAELPPHVFTAAQAGDRIAQEIIERQADEVVTMAGAAIRHLGMVRDEVDVVLGGGIFRTTYDRFFAHIRAGLRTVSPRARLTRLLSPPIVGAALLGLDQAGAPAAAKDNVRRNVTYGALESTLNSHLRKGGETWRASSSTA
jgi:N-acetylglucosamine kinase-like BadF-type ATPase